METEAAPTPTIVTRIPVLGIAAFSGTGKTTLLSQLIPLLRARQLRIGIIKHSHHNFDIDHPGKDSYVLRHAGAESVMLVSKYRRAMITDFPEAVEPRLCEQLADLNRQELDLILVEGFKRERFPKIELHRPALGKPLLFPHDDTVVAVATDAPLGVVATIPVLDLNQPSQIAEFILKHIKIDEGYRLLSH